MPGWVEGEPLHGYEEYDATHNHFASLTFFESAEPVDESEGNQYCGGEATDGDYDVPAAFQVGFDLGEQRVKGNILFVNHQ